MATWTSDSSIVSGLTDIGTYASPTVFLDGSTFKSISSAGNGFWYGWYWNGSSWVSDSSIINGLIDIGSGVTPTVFLDGSTLKLIAGESGSGSFTGWYWNGSIWTLDAGIVNGLTNLSGNSAPTVFLDGSTLKLISGKWDFPNGGWYGWYWNGSSWVSDSSIVSGLPSDTSFGAPTVFLDGSTFKLIFGTAISGIFGWYWNGSIWTLDSNINDGLPTGAGYQKPTVFTDGSIRKLIYGDNTGNFFGYFSLITYTISGYVYDQQSNPISSATVRAAGGLYYPTTSDSTGAYSLTVNPGIYNVTASKTNYHFDTQTVDASSSDQTQNFTLTQTPVSLAGGAGDRIIRKMSHHYIMTKIGRHW